MSSLNKVFLIGRVVAAPELRYTPKGTAMAKFALAVDRPKSKDNERETDFFNIVAWQRLGEFCGEYLQKGRLICVTGSIHTRTYETKEGQKRKDFEIRADEVELLTPRQSPETNGPSDSQHGPEPDFDMDEVPF